MDDASNIRRILNQYSAESVAGIKQSDVQRLPHLRKLAEAGAVRTLEPFLPLCLTLQGKPYDLSNHFPFSPLFKTHMPSQLVYKCGRQVSKSTSLAAHGVILSGCLPYFRTLYVTPLYEQIRRFSNNYVRPFIDRSPIKPLWSGTSTENSVLQRSFKNLSVMLFSFALLDADRIRGISADRVSMDEIQDMDPDHIPVIREVMSYSQYGLFQFAGTPKTLDNPLEGLWSMSSQAEWFIKCFSCGRWNIPALEFDLNAMIGPYHDDISEQIPGVICANPHCRRPIYPRQGHWVHRYPERRYTMAGYHVPQMIMPLHYSSPKKWSELLAKQRGAWNTSEAKFYNEVMGESVDAGQKLITQTELQAAATLPWENNTDEPSPILMERLQHYTTRVLACDWGGGGEEGVSFTALALLGYTPEGQIHVLWGKKLTLSQDHIREATEIMHWLQKFRCHMLAHDYTGAGVVRETVLIQAGFNMQMVMPISYVRAASSALIKYVPPTPQHARGHYRLDKTRSLLYMFTGFRLKLIRSFAYDHKDRDTPGLLHDLLALVENKAESRLAGDIYTITRNPMLSDDFAQAVNFGCAALWHMHDAWPDYATAADIGRISVEQVEAAGNGDYGWDQDNTFDFFSMP